VNARTSSAALMLASMPHLGRETIRGEVTPSPSERRPWSSPGVPLFFPTERAKTGPPEHAALLGYDASASKGQRDLASMILSLASESQRVESSAHPDLSIRLVSGQHSVSRENIRNIQNQIVGQGTQPPEVWTSFRVNLLM